MLNKKTILVVDDHTLFREGLKTIISRNPAYEVVGETGRGDSAIQMARSLRPDLVLVDISLPDQSGIEVALQVRKSLPKTAIMMVTMHSGLHRECLHGHRVCHQVGPERLHQAIDVVLKAKLIRPSPRRWFLVGGINEPAS
jgi:DNA-binding NarL/FixJ family response regulator